MRGMRDQPSLFLIPCLGYKGAVGYEKNMMRKNK